MTIRATLAIKALICTLVAAGCVPDGTDQETLGTASFGLSTPTGAMSAPRYMHEAVPLPNGSVFVTGGYTAGGVAQFAELFQPATGTWVSTSAVTARGYGLTATFIGNDKVLVAGGSSMTATTQVYDAAWARWYDSGTLTYPRQGHTATQLANGKVLVTGGQLNTGANTASAELYDPWTGVWWAAASMTYVRLNHTATRLADGRVLVAGTYGSITQAELYDPATNTWSMAGRTAQPRGQSDSLLLPSGKVLVVGGMSSPSTAEVYDPATNTWTATGALLQGRQDHRLVLLANGDVLAVGGQSGGAWLRSVERWKAATGTWTPETTLDAAHDFPTATLLASGAVLVVGGTTSPGAEVFMPDSGPCVPTTCAAQSKNCGALADGCGGTLQCGSCSGGQACESNVCTSSAPIVTAFYDPVRRAPVCSSSGKECTSGSLLNGRATLGPEFNAPNTLNASCADGTSGTYHGDESLDRLRILSVDGGPLAPGKQARIEATVWVWGASSDYLDLYSAADASSPTWTFLGTVSAPAGGAQVLSKTFTLPQRAGLQAVRGRFRYGGSASGPCVAGPYNDHDDLVFLVASASDTTAPLVSLTTPSAGALLSGTRTLTATATDAGGVTRVEFWDGSALLGSDTTSPYAYSWDTRTANAGSHTLVARAYDQAGNTGTSATVSVVVDNVAPQVALTAPAAGAVPTGYVNLAAAASDAAGVTRVDFYDGEKLLGSDFSAPFGISWDTGPAGGGAHQLSARAVDSAGNVGTSSPVGVIVDSDNPQVQISHPTHMSTVSGVVTLTAVAIDQGGVARVDFYAGDTLLGSSATAPYAVDWDTRAGANGFYLLRARAYDVLGREGLSSEIHVFVQNDQTAPEVTLTQPAAGALLTGATSLAATAADAGGVARVDFYDGGALLGSVSAPPYTLTWNTNSAANGSHQLTARALDLSGNVGVSLPVEVTVDNDLPAVSLTAPSPMATVAGVVTVSAAATDAVGIARVDFYADETPLGSRTTPPYSVAWDTWNVSNGAHILRARAFDLAGHHASVDVQVQVENDHTAPEVALTQPAAGAIVAGVTTLTAAATDAGGLVRVDFYDGAVLLGSVAAPPWVLAWDASSAAGGSHLLVARAIDTSGNVGASLPVDVLVDVDLPQVALTAPAPMATVSGVATLTAVATDQVGVARVDFYAGETLLGSSATAPYSLAWDTRAAANGQHAVQARAYDLAGREGLSPVVPLIVENDQTPPEVALAEPEEGATVSGTRSLVALATDAIGVIRVDFYEDTTLLGSVSSAPYVLSWDTRTVPNGTHLLRARAHDLAGNIGTSAPVSVTVDNDHLAPQIAWSEPLPDSALRGAIALAVTASDAVGVARVQFFDGAQLLETRTEPPYTFLWDTGAAADGPHALTARAYDAAGNEGVAGPVAVTVDNTPPHAALTAPPAGATLTGTISLTATASDAAGVVRVEFFDGSASLGQAATPPYTLSWNTRNTTNGAHVLQVKAFDAAGNVGESAAVAVTLQNDFTKPVVTFTTPSAGATVSGGLQPSATATDDRGVVRVEFYSDETRRWTDTEPPYTFWWDTRFASNGAHTLRALAYDAEGNVGTAELAVTVDNEFVPPTVSLTAPAEGATVRLNVLFTVEVADNRSVTSVGYSIDGAGIGSATKAPFSFWWYSKNAPNGPHTIRATARDASGNETTSAPVTVIVENDLIPPQVALDAPAGGSPVTGVVELRASATDNEQVTRVEFYDGSTLIGTAPAAPFTLGWNTFELPNGPRTLTARAFDASYNSSTSAAVTVEVNNLPPNAAHYDANLRAPLCEGTAPTCDSGTLLNGRAGLGPEANAPNALHGNCTDGTAGTYHSSESLDRLTIYTSDGTPLTEGMTVTIAATVWAAWSSQNDWLDLYGAADANQPVWTHIATLNPGDKGKRTLTATYTLPAGERQVIRGVFRYGGTAAPCVPSAYNDVDDLVFDVER